MTLLEPTDSRYYIKPRTVNLMENDAGDVNRIYVSIASGTTIMVYVSDGNLIPYDDDKEYQKWVLSGFSTKLSSSDAYYVYARLNRSDNRAMIVFSSKKYNVDGSIEGSVGNEDASDRYFYIKLGFVTAANGTNGRSIEFDSGKLSTPDNSYTKEESDAQFLNSEKANELFLNALSDDTAKGVITFEKGVRFGNLLLALEGNDTLFLKNTLTGEQANFAASGAIATKGVGASSGGGGVVPWSEIENSIIPKVTDTYSIGTNTNKWQSIYAIEGHINSLVAHALSAESIKLNGKDVATKEYVIAMIAQGGGGGTGGSSTVSYLPTIEEGKEIGTLIVDGVSYGLFAPSKYSWEEIDDKPNFAKVAFSGSYNDLTDVPTIPTIVGLASEEWVNTQLVDYQKKITSSNKLSYALISGTPTSLPASDVSAWAKADSKPSYSWNEINSRPTKLSEFTDDVVKGVYQPLITTEKKLAYTLISGVPTSLKNPYSLKFGSKSYDGSSQKEITASDLGALTSHQTIYTLTIQKNGEEVGTFTPNSKDATINIDDVVTLSDEQEITGRKTFTGGVRLDSNTVIRNAQFIGTDASDAVLWKVDNTGNATFVNGVLGGTLSVTKESTFTGETTHNGGIIIPSGKTLKIGNTVIEEKDGGLFVNGDLAASGSVATKGVGSSSGGGGNSYGRLDDWDNYNASNGDVLSALLGYGLKSDIATLTSKFGNYFTKIETRNEIVDYLHDFNDEMIIPNYSTKSEVGSLADVVGGIGSRVSILEGKATAVSFAQTLQSGKQIGVLTIDGTPTTLFSPASYAWGEITSRPTKLSDFTDDVVSGKYLSLSGGTLSSANVPLVINRKDGNYSSIKYQLNGTDLGILGFDTNGIAVVSTKRQEGNSQYYTLLHTGNYTDYTYSKTQVDTKLGDYLPLSGGVMTGGLTLAIKDITETNRHDLYIGRSNLAEGAAFDYASFINIGDRVSSQLQLSWHRDYSNPKLAIRLHESAKWSDWKTIAFTDSNVASANYATSAGNADTLDGLHADRFDKVYTSSFTVTESGWYRLVNVYTYSCNLDWKDKYIVVNTVNSAGTPCSSSFKILYSTQQGWNVSYNNEFIVIPLTRTNAKSVGNVRLLSATGVNARYIDVYIALPSGTTEISVAIRSNISGAHLASEATLSFDDVSSFTVIERNADPEKSRRIGGLIAETATKLSTHRTIWGQSFDGSGNVSGALGLGHSKIYWYSDANNYYINADYSIASNASNLNYCAFNGHRFATGSVEIMRLLSNGNVLIGTTTDYGYKLYVDGNSYVNGSLSVTNGIGLARNDANYVWASGGSNSYLLFGVSNVGSTSWGNASLRITTVGNVEISKSLTVSSSAKVNSLNVNDKASITNDGALSVSSGITSAGAITIKDTLYGIGTTGVIRGSKLVSEGTIETSTLKVGSILIEDKDGDLFINGNLAASGSVATKGIGTSSSGGSATIPWSEVPMSILPANNTLDLGSNAKPWDRVFSSYFGTDNNHTIITGTSVNIVSDLYFSNGIDHIDTDGNAYLHSIYMDDELVATEAWVNTKLGAAASYGIGYVQSGNNGLVTGNSVYVALTSYDSDVLANKYAKLDNTYTKTQVNNNFAAKSEAEIVYSVSVTGDRNVAPSLNLDCGNGVWSLRNVFNGTNGDLKFLFDTQQKAQLTTEGDLSISGRLTQSSDETLKNILGYNVDMKVKDIANAPICYFTWKDRVSDRQIGTIAQYWKLITPECVIGKEGRMSMDYSTLGLVSSIVNAREIVKHEDEIETLKKRVKELEDKLAAVSAA